MSYEETLLKATNVSEKILEFRNITKKFGDFYANHDINFSINSGTIHAIIGENGAGKSTLMKILFGLQQPTNGEIYLHGRRVQFQSAVEAKRAYLGMVHQHFMLADPITALDHIILDQKQSGSFLDRILPLSRKGTLKKIEALAEKFRMPVPWNEPIENLSVGIQQRIEILKLLFNDSEILILDEPTAVLTPQEIDAFFEQLFQLKQSGKTIIIITHKLKEVLRLSDNFTVLRQGKVVFSGITRGHSVESLGELMIGRRLQKNSKTATVSSFSQPSLQPPSSEILSYALEIKRVSYEQKRSMPRHKKSATHQKQKSKALLSNLTLHVRYGEVSGIAGVEGNGQSELLHALISPKSMPGNLAGEIQVRGKNILNFASKKIRSLGVSYFPEDRLKQALLLNESAEYNFILGQQFRGEFQNKGILLWKKIHASTRKMMEEFDVRPLDLNLPLGKFSGGNQQKFVVGRELFLKPNLLIAAQPTRGVDIGATESIHSHILSRKKQGGGVLLISSDLDELMHLSDRIYVIFQGTIVGEFIGPTYDERRLGSLMGGGQ